MWILWESRSLWFLTWMLIIKAREAARDDGNSVKPPKKYMIPVTGLIAGGIDDWNNYSWSVYTDIDGLKEQLKKAFKKGTVIPGQPTNKKKPLNYIVYNSAESL